MICWWWPPRFCWMLWEMVLLVWPISPWWSLMSVTIPTTTILTTWSWIGTWTSSYKTERGLKPYPWYVISPLTFVTVGWKFRSTLYLMLIHLQLVLLCNMILILSFILFRLSRLNYWLIWNTVNYLFETFRTLFTCIR